LKQKGLIFYVFVNIKKIHHKPQPSDHQAFAVKGKRERPTPAKDPPQPSLFREGVITIANGYHSRFSNICSLPKQGIYGIARAMLSLLRHCRVM